MVSRVGIFWDYENCHPNSSLSGCTVASNLRSIALQFGPIVSFKAYVDVSLEGPRAMALQTQLQASGVSLTHCPHNSMKEVVDRALTVDMLAFAFDSPPPATVIIITGDRDYTYAISTIRMRGHRVVLIMPTTRTPENLKQNVDVALYWKDVLEWSGQATFTAPAQIDYSPVHKPPTFAGAICPENTARLLRVESVISDASEDAEIVVISRAPSGIGKEFSTSKDKLLAMPCARIVSDEPSQSEWQIVEEDALETEGYDDVREFSVWRDAPWDALIEDYVSVGQPEKLVEDDLTSISEDVFSGNRNLALQSVPSVDRVTSSTNSSTSSVEPEQRSEDVQLEIQTPEGPEPQSAPKRSHQPGEQICQNSLGDRLGSGSTKETPWPSRTVGVSSVSVPCAPSFHIPVKFQILVTVMRKAGYHNGKIARLSELALTLRQANPQYDKGHGGPKRYVQAARDSRIVVISGDETGGDFFVQLNRRAISAVNSTPSRTLAQVNTHTTAKFATLVNVLKDLRSKHDIQPHFSIVGTQLLRRDPGIYGRIGCSKLKKYLEMAREAKVVVLGKNWVKLNAELF